MLKQYEVVTFLSEERRDIITLGILSQASELLD